MLLGCSFTYGDGLEDTEAFHSVLSKDSKRTIYNLGISAGSPTEALYFLREKEIRDDIIKIEEPIEYVIYTYIPGHEERVFNDNHVPKYKSINNDTKLVKANTDYFFKSYLIKYTISNMPKTQ